MRNVYSSGLMIPCSHHVRIKWTPASGCHLFRAHATMTVLMKQNKGRDLRDSDDGFAFLFAQVIHRLNSPNVVKLYDWHETRSCMCLILELCAGGDLGTLIQQVLPSIQALTKAGREMCV